MDFITSKSGTKSHSTFAFFNFTCGNYTTGTGYAMLTSKVGMENKVLQTLEEGGERNCKVIFERMNNVDGSDSEYDPHRFRGVDVKGIIYSGVNYKVEQRWYTHLGKFSPLILPYIGQRMVSAMKNNE